MYLDTALLYQLSTVVTAEKEDEFVARDSDETLINPKYVHM